jgi:hypothetical protein
MRYGLRRDPTTVRFPFFVGAVSVAIFVVTIVTVGFNIWLLLLGFAMTLLVYVSWEVSFRTGSYLILYESYLDVRQLGWGKNAIGDRARILYSDILRLRVINDREVEIVYAKRPLTGDPDRDMEAIALQSLNPHAIALDVQGRVERALEGPAA